MKKTLSIIVALAMALALVIVPMTASAGTTVSGSQSYNGISYQVYVPSSYSAGTAVPMYVMLHGCTQNASSFATSTGMNKFAEEKGFIVLYVQQSSSNNQNCCFNWFEPGDMARNSGEPKDIYNIVKKVMSTYTIDENRIFAAGFSAGAYMASVLGATYPDLYSGIVVNSGGPYKAATSMTAAFSVMSSGSSNSASTTANYIISAMGSYKRVVPCMVFQGTGDYTVAQKNGVQVAESWAYANSSIDSTISKTGKQTSGTTTGGASFTRTSYSNTAGVEVVVLYLVSGMSHAWSGGEGYSYAYSAGPSANKLSYEFFMNYYDGVAAAPSEGTTVVDSGSGSESGSTGDSTGSADWMSYLPDTDITGIGNLSDYLSGILNGVGTGSTGTSTTVDWTQYTSGYDWSSMMGGYDWSSMMGGYTMPTYDWSSMMGGYTMPTYDWSSMMGGYDWSSMMSGYTMPTYDFSSWTGSYDWSSMMGNYDWSSWMNTGSYDYSSLFGGVDYTNWWSNYLGNLTDTSGWMNSMTGGFSGMDGLNYEMPDYSSYFSF